MAFDARGRIAPLTVPAAMMAAHGVALALAAGLGRAVAGLLLLGVNE